MEVTNKSLSIESIGEIVVRQVICGLYTRASLSLNGRPTTAELIDADVRLRKELATVSRPCYRLEVALKGGAGIVTQIARHDIGDG
jgi:hypothetical protein